MDHGRIWTQTTLPGCTDTAAWILVLSFVMACSVTNCFFKNMNEKLFQKKSIELWNVKILIQTNLLFSLRSIFLLSSKQKNLKKATRMFLFNCNLIQFKRTNGHFNFRLSSIRLLGHAICIFWGTNFGKKVSIWVWIKKNALGLNPVVSVLSKLPISAWYYCSHIT